MPFKVVIEPRALEDAQKAIDYYDNKQAGLGEKFHSALTKHLESIEKNPFFQLRYKDYRGLPIKNYPFIIFFYINEKVDTVYVIGIFNTYQNPNKYPT
jgi:toxin ParE1/3/4